MVSGGEASAIQGHWNGKVKPNLQAVGNALFVKYFTANPGDQALFKSFAGVGVGDLPSNAAFNKQTLAVMNYMDKVVAGMGSNAAQLMKDQVAPHTARGISVDQIKVSSCDSFYMGSNCVYAYYHSAVKSCRKSLCL